MSGQRASLPDVVAALRAGQLTTHGREERRRSEMESLRADLDAAARRRLQETADAIPESVTRWDAVRDGSGHVVDFEVAFSNLTGNRLLAQLTGPDWAARHTRVSTMGEAGVRAFGLLRRALEGDQPVERELGGANGLRRHIATYARIGATDSVVVTARDIHDRWLAERALAAAEARARALVEQSPAATFVLDEALTVTQVNDAAAVLLGLPRERIAGRDVGAVLGHASRTSLLALLASLDCDAEVYRLELGYTRPDGRDRLLRLQIGVAGTRGADLSLVGHLRDVTDEASAAARLQHDATHDALTSLPNRWLAMTRLRQALDAWTDDREVASVSDALSSSVSDALSSSVSDAPSSSVSDALSSSVSDAVCVVFVDLDGLKAVNDSWGHAAGDELLIDAAHRICAAVRPHDTVARLGGDEFVVLLDEPLSELAARRVAGRIRRALGQPFVLSQGVSTSGASVGVALSQPGDTADSLLARADIAMYADKTARRAMRSA
ncbi:MAG: diguanylate cyclase domain-containing protein [Actinomycetales bacterium]